MISFDYSFNRFELFEEMEWELECARLYRNCTMYMCSTQYSSQLAGHSVKQSKNWNSLEIYILFYNSDVHFSAIARKFVTIIMTIAFHVKSIPIL